METKINFYWVNIFKEFDSRKGRTKGLYALVLPQTIVERGKVIVVRIADNVSQLLDLRKDPNFTGPFDFVFGEGQWAMHFRLMKVSDNPEAIKHFFTKLHKASKNPQLPDNTLDELAAIFAYKSQVGKGDDHE